MTAANASSHHPFCCTSLPRLTCCRSARRMMTLPSTDRLLLIAVASFSRSPRWPSAARCLQQQRGWTEMDRTHRAAPRRQKPHTASCVACRARPVPLPACQPDRRPDRPLPLDAALSSHLTATSHSNAQDATALSTGFPQRALPPACHSHLPRQRGAAGRAWWSARR